MPGAKRGERPAALDEFMAALRTLREQAGQPSFRHMAAKSGAVSHSTLHLTVTGHRLQPWETVREFVRACDGDEAEWHFRWQRVSEALRDEPATPRIPVKPGTPAVADGNGDHAESLAPMPREEPPAEAESPRNGEIAPKASRRSFSFAAAFAVAVLATSALVTVYTLADGANNSGSASERSVSAGTDHNGEVYVGDESAFLGDVTYPDGSVVPAGSRFTKIWEIRNTGSVQWRDRSLKRIDLPMESGDCITPLRVPVPDTRPGQKARIAVTVRTPPESPVRSETPVHCKVHWKMIDESGRLLLPGYRPIYFEVQVR